MRQMDKGKKEIKILLGWIVKDLAFPIEVFGLNPKATGYFGGLLSRRQCFSNLIITVILLIEIVFEDFFRIDLPIFIMICTLLCISFNYI